MKKQKQDENRAEASKEIKAPRSSSIGTPNPIAMRKLLNFLLRQKQKRMQEEKKESES
jgi:hypothetical protein